MRWRRVLGGLGIATAVVVGVATLSLVGFLGFLATDTGNDWARRKLEVGVTSVMAKGSFHVGELETDLLYHLRVKDLELRDDAGRPLIRLREARARYDLFTLATGPLQVLRLEGVGLDVVLDQGDERLALAELFGPPSGSTEPFSLPLDLDVASLLVEGVALQVDDSFVMTGGVVTGGLILEGPVFIGSDVQACVHLIQPGPLPVCAEGPFTWDGNTAVLSGLVVEGPGAAIAVEGIAGFDDVSLQLSVGQIQLDAIDPLANNVGLDGSFAGVLRVQGPPADLTASGEFSGVLGTQGQVVLRDGYWRTNDETTWGGQIRALDFDVEQAWPGTGRPIVLDGDLELDATGLQFPDGLTLDLEYDGAAKIEDQYDVEDGHFVGRLEKGILDLTEGAFHGIAGPLTATGEIDLQKGPLDLRIGGSLDGKELADLGITGLGGSNSLDLRLKGDLKRNAGTFNVGGTATFAPLLYNGVRVEHLTARLNGVVEGSDFRFAVDAEGTGGDALGVKLATLGATGLDVQSTRGTLTAVGPVSATGVAYEGVGTFADAHFQVDARLPKDAPIDVTADGGVGAFDIQTFLGSGGTVRVGLVGDALNYAVRLEDSGRLLASSKGNFDLGTKGFEARTLELAPTARLSWTAAAPVTFTLVDGGVTNADVDLRGLHGDFRATGALGTRGVLDGAFTVQNFQLDALAELFPDRFEGLSGVLGVEGTVRGPADAIEFDAETSLLGLWVEGSTRWLDVQGTLAGKQGTVTADLALGVAGEPLAKLRGGLPVVLDLAQAGLNPTGQVAMNIELLPGALERLENATVAELGLTSGTVSAAIDVTGMLSDPDVRARGILQQPLGSWEDDARLEFDVQRRLNRLVAHGVVREGLAERAAIDAEGETRAGEVTRWLTMGGDAPDTSDLELWLDDMVASLVLSSVPAESLLAMANNTLPASGQISGTMTATGSPYTPTLRGDVQWFRGEFAGYELDAGSARVEPTPKGLALDIDLALAAGGHGSVEGTLPIAIDLRQEASTWAEGPLDLAIDAQDLPLGMLAAFDSGLTEAQGAIDLAGTIKGTLAEPDGDLAGAIRDGSFTYRDLGLRVSRLSGDLEGKRRRVKVTRLTAHTEPVYPIGLFEDGRRSEISMVGSANLEGLSIGELTAKVDLNDAWIAGLSNLAVRTEGSVLVSGAWPEVLVKGDVNLVNGRITYDPDKFAAAGKLSPDRRLVIHRAGRVEREIVVEPSVLQDIDLDLHIDLNRNLELVAAYPIFEELGSLTANLTRANVSARLGGEVDVSLDDAGSPQLGGELDVVGGAVQLLRTEFDLTEGHIYFLGGDWQESQLELNGSTSVQGNPIDLQVRGAVLKPEITTTSPGYDQSQVLVMLITNRAPESLATDQGAQAANEARQLGTAAALLLATSVLKGSAAGALSIDPDGSVKVGVPWSSSIYSQAVLNAFADLEENRVAAAVDWSITPKVVLEIGLGDRFQWTDLTWETRF